jgi:excisionase family DNA binding protein
MDTKQTALSTAIKVTPQPLTPMALTVLEACKISKVGRSKLYIAVQTGALRARKLGKKTLILPEDLQRWLADLPHYEPKRRLVAAE